MRSFYLSNVAVVSFARATGDLHALSAVDTRLLALAHTLEVSYYGSAHLRDKPAPPKIQKKRVIDVKVLPGWGAEGGDWAEIDRLNEEEDAAAEALLSTAGASHIASQVQQLSLADAEAAAAEFEAEGNGDDGAQQAQQEFEEESGSDSDGNSTEEDDDDDEWEVAAKTKNKARRAKRKAYRRAEYQAEAANHQQEEREEEEESDEENDESDDSNSDAEESIEEGSTATENNENNDEKAAESRHPEGESLVCCVTGDFAMQNVLLQMGLRLAAPDGHRITSVSRWVLRCSACYQVTKEVGRLFCPRCGNAALDKVKVTVGADGAEQYGVKKKHILRGTKFSLPRPKGGRNRDPILREDQLLTKKHLLRAQKAAEKAAADQFDPFAPEYTADTWHQAAALPDGMQGAAALLAGWKKNPNERKHRATNRRRK